MTIVTNVDEYTARRVEANLYKLVNVLRVEEVTHIPTVMRDLALIKVRADAETRTQVLQICDVYRARVVDVTQDSLIIESTGTEDKIDSLVEVLTSFGIIELVRNRETREPMAPWDGSSPEMRAFKQYCLEHGLYLDVHWHTALIIPPLIISEEQLAEGFAILDKALEITDRVAG